ncbi:MAG TPA: sigma-70 family RNA polymerase sigma factor [Polyangiaceae bacterium]|nr:sigma-70 family RNA polymerase sigma factor [Polyangiaceae bacterium]
MASPQLRLESAAGSPSSTAPIELSEATDAELACELQAGAPGAARVVWLRYSPMVRRMLARALGPERDVEDSLQEVFLCLFNKAGELRNPASLRAFIVSIAIRTLRREIRRRKLRSWLRLDGNAPVEDLRAVNPDTDAREALIRFYALLDRLNSRDRSVFVLHVIEGMDVEAIASALEVSVPTIRRSLTRGRERIALLAGRDPMLVDYVSKLERGVLP